MIIQKWDGSFHNPVDSLRKPEKRIELPDLYEYNRRKEIDHAEQRKNIRSGVACPKCGEELYELQAGMIYMTCPPRKPVKCTRCGFEGTKVV